MVESNVIEKILEQFKFYLQMKEEYYIVERAIRNNRKLPRWFTNQPQLSEHEATLSDAYITYWESLSSERIFKGGKIPWNKIVHHGTLLGKNNQDLQDHILIIQKLDDFWLERVRKQKIRIKQRKKEQKEQDEINSRKLEDQKQNAITTTQSQHTS